MKTQYLVPVLGALEQAWRECGIVGAVERDAVAFDDATAGVHDTVAKRPVVSEQEHPLAVLVEAPDAEKLARGKLRRDELEHSPVVVRVVVCAKQPARFVDEKDYARGVRTHHRLAVEAHLVLPQSDALPECCGGAIDGDDSVGDELFRGPPGANTGLREKFLQPHGFIFCHALASCGQAPRV